MSDLKPIFPKTNWKDFPDTSTPLTADKLNEIEEYLAYAYAIAHALNKDWKDTDTQVADVLRSIDYTNKRVSLMMRDISENKSKLSKHDVELEDIDEDLRNIHEQLTALPEFRELFAALNFEGNNLIPGGWDDFEDYGSGVNLLKNWDFSRDFETWINYGEIDKAIRNGVAIIKFPAKKQSRGIATDYALELDEEYVVRVCSRYVSKNKPKRVTIYMGNFHDDYIESKTGYIDYKERGKWQVDTFIMTKHLHGGKKRGRFEFYNKFSDDESSEVEVKWIQITPRNNQHLVVEKTPLGNGLTRIQTWGGNNVNKIRLELLQPSNIQHSLIFYYKNMKDTRFFVRTRNGIEIIGPKSDGFLYMEDDHNVLASYINTNDVEEGLDFIASDPIIVEGDDIPLNSVSLKEIAEEVAIARHWSLENFAKILELKARVTDLEDTLENPFDEEEKAEIIEDIRKEMMEVLEDLDIEVDFGPVNSQIAELESSISSLKAEFEDKLENMDFEGAVSEEDLESVREIITGVEASVKALKEELETSIASNTSDIADLESKVKEVKELTDSVKVLLDMYAKKEDLEQYDTAIEELDEYVKGRYSSLSTRMNNMDRSVGGISEKLNDHIEDSDSAIDVLGKDINELRSVLFRMPGENKILNGNFKLGGAYWEGTYKFKDGELPEVWCYPECVEQGKTLKYGGMVNVSAGDSIFVVWKELYTGGMPSTPLEEGIGVNVRLMNLMKPQEGFVDHIKKHSESISLGDGWFLSEIPNLSYGYYEMEVYSANLFSRIRLAYVNVSTPIRVPEFMGYLDHYTKDRGRQRVLGLFKMSAFADGYGPHGTRKFSKFDKGTVFDESANLKFSEGKVSLSNKGGVRMVKYTISSSLSIMAGGYFEDNTTFEVYYGSKIVDEFMIDLSSEDGSFYYDVFTYTGFFELSDTPKEFSIGFVPVGPDTELSMDLNVVIEGIGQ